MFDRKEYESWFGPISNDEWKAIQKQLSEMEEKMWEEDHPMDD